MARYLTAKFLSAAEEKTLIADWRNHKRDRSARALISAFKPLLNGVLKRYRHYGIDRDDLRQEASLGLCVALERYDFDKNARFASYAKFWINARCQDYVMRNWSIVRVGTTNTHKKLFFRLRYLKRELDDSRVDLGRTAVIVAIAGESGISVYEVRTMYDRLTLKDRYLDEKITENSPATYADILPSRLPSQESALLNRERDARHVTVLRIIGKTLNRLERDILYGRRLAEPPLTFEEIGLEHGLSGERARRIEMNSLRKLKLALRSIKIYSS